MSKSIFPDESSFVPYHAVTNLDHGRVLVLAPHPDDEVLGCGGALLRHVQQDDEVKVVVVTDGGFPVSPLQKTEDYRQIRMNESLQAAGVLGYSHPVFLGYADRSLHPDEKLIGDFMGLLKTYQPEILYLPGVSEIHPDHRAVYRAGTIAAQKCSLRLMLCYYEIAQMQQVNLLHDITDLHAQLEQAVACFESQLAVQDYRYHINALHAYRTYTLPSSIKYAEGYFRISNDKMTLLELDIRITQTE
jgi:LmbE family N-acetylglucosaminyl deacetylase